MVPSAGPAAAERPSRPSARGGRRMPGLGGAERSGGIAPQPADSNRWVFLFRHRGLRPCRCRQLLCPATDGETTGRRRSEAAQVHPVLTPTYFSREHVLGAACALLGGSLVPGAATATLTVTQSEFSLVCPHSLSPSLTPHGSALGCSRNAHVVGQWGPCTAGGPTWARAEVSADPLCLVALSFINSG